MRLGYTSKSVAVLATLAMVASTASAAADPFDGEWRIDLARSQSAAESADSSDQLVDMVIEMRTDGPVLHYNSETSYRSGRISQTHYTANYDGSLSLVTGTRGLLAPVSLKRIDANTVEASYIRSFHVIVVSRRTVSEDGTVMTITTTPVDPAGKDIVSVFVRVRPQ